MHIRFDRFEFDLGRRALLENGSEAHLSPRAFRLLEILTGNAPRAMSKEELSAAIWPDTVVDESNLATLVAELRTALGDEARAPKFIRTVHGFGYSFCGEIAEAGGSSPAGYVEFAGAHYPLHEGDNVLGRDPSADVTIEHVTVSRRHACITVRDGVATLRDLSSKNGTFLAGSRIDAEVPLENGAAVVLGDARLVFRSSLGSSTVTLAGRRFP